MIHHLTLSLIPGYLILNNNNNNNNISVSGGGRAAGPMGLPYLRAVTQRTWACHFSFRSRCVGSLQKAFGLFQAKPGTHHRLCGGIPHLEKKLVLGGDRVYSICPSVKQGTSEYPKSSGVTIPAGPPPWV